MDAVVAEAARVLRPGGLLVTTVDKSLAHGTDRRAEADHRPRLDAVAGECGLRPAGGTTFSGRSRWGSATGGDPVFTARRLPPGLSRHIRGDTPAEQPQK